MTIMWPRCIDSTVSPRITFAKISDGMILEEILPQKRHKKHKIRSVNFALFAHFRSYLLHWPASNARFRGLDQLSAHRPAYGRSPRPVPRRLTRAPLSQYGRQRFLFRR